jgi:hypothetical protein
MRASITIIALGVVAAAANAQVINYTGGTYSQNFDSLPNTGTQTRPTGPSATAAGVAGHLWDNGVTVNGWYYTFENSASVGVTPVTNGNWIHAGVIGSGGNTIPDYNVRFLRINDGANNAGSAYNYGTTGSSDRALGALNSGGATSPLRNTIGVRLVNGGNTKLTQFTLNYRGEQWRKGNATDPDPNLDRQDFSWSVIAGGTFDIANLRQPVTSGWTDANALDNITSTNVGAAGARDGNVFFTNVGATVTGIDWDPGEELVLRWVDFDRTSSDDALAIDDVSFQAVPEPGTMAALGLGALALIRKRRNAK